MRFCSSVIVSVCGVALLALSGCSDQQRSGAQVSGTVLIDGAPLAFGVIHFESVNQGQANAATPVEQGKYTLPKGNGLVAGNYKVSIKSANPPVTETDPNKAMELASKPAPREKILPKYNTATILTAELQEGTPNVVDFEVTTK